MLASYRLGEADLLRRAMGKKNPKAMAEQRDRFMNGAAKLGHPKAPVEEIFEQMAKFSDMDSTSRTRRRMRWWRIRRLI